MSFHYYTIRKLSFNSENRRILSRIQTAMIVFTVLTKPLNSPIFECFLHLGTSLDIYRALRSAVIPKQNIHEFPSLGHALHKRSVWFDPGAVAVGPVRKFIRGQSSVFVNAGARLQRGFEGCYVESDAAACTLAGKLECM
jgi:hypothetical protein